MGAATKYIRFMGNDFTTGTATTLTVSSEQALYPASNLQLAQRYKHWAPAGEFTIDANSFKFHYTEDSVSRIANLTYGTYTGDELATELLGKLVGGTYTVVYNADFTFTITKTDGGTFELDVATTITSIWDILGFTGGVDLTGALSYTSDEQRAHMEETIDWDLGSDLEVTFFGMIAKREDDFTLSNSAIITLEADSIPIGASPAFTRTLTRTNEGVFEFLDDAADNTYRYWKLTIQDRTNPLGGQGLKIGVAYLGDHIGLTSRGVEKGFKKTQVDPSLKNTSESGATYYKIKNRFTRFSNLSMPYLTAIDRKGIEDFFYDKGNFAPFFISIDPMLLSSTDLKELTKYVKFDGDPIVTHVKQDIYTIHFNAVEDL